MILASNLQDPTEKTENLTPEYHKIPQKEGRLTEGSEYKSDVDFDRDVDKRGAKGIDEMGIK
jgi:hypothetical protein